MTLLLIAASLVRSVGIAVAVLGLATAISLPTLSRLLHADGLHTE